MSAPKMTEVAERARVSLKTVSRVVNGEQGVSPVTAAKVHKAIAELGYKRNELAAALRRGGSARAAGELSQEERVLVGHLLQEHIYVLDRQIREDDALSEPCPAGHWRWADAKHAGYGLKSEDELATDREAAKARAVVHRAKREVAIAALWKVRDGLS